MCQAYEAEKNYVIARDLSEVKEIWRKHESGEAPLTNEQIHELAVRKFMLLNS